MDKQQIQHTVVIDDFLHYLNTQTDGYVLKGGTSLMECYQLDRASEDIDLDARKPEDGLRKGIIQHVEEYCAKRGYTYRVAKDTDTVKRCFVHYNENNKPLKIETSFRSLVQENNVTQINGITVYCIEEIARQKTNAYLSRDRIRDLYDLCFIVNNFKDKLSTETLNTVREGFAYKGIEQFDYIVSQEHDPLIDNEQLMMSFLKARDSLGLDKETSIKIDHRPTQDYLNDYKELYDDLER